MLVKLRKKLQKLYTDFDSVELWFQKMHPLIGVSTYIIFVLARFGLEFALFAVSVPLHLSYSPQKGFQIVADRAPSGEYLSSYAHFVQNNRYSVAVILLTMLVIGIQLLGAITFTLFVLAP